MNILFLNGGRRCELIDAFRNALNRRGGGRIAVSDISPIAPALRKADVSTLLPRTSDPEFPQRLAEFVERENIELLIPSIDPDLVALDAIRERLNALCPNLTLLLPPSETVKLARDKRLTKQRFKELGANVPEYVDATDTALEFPVFVKPPDGSSSVGAKLVADALELKAELAKRPDLMVEKVVGGPEYTVDVLCDFNGKALYAVPRKRLKVRGGEVSQGVVEMRKDLIELAKRLAEGFHAQGPVTLQFRMPEEGVYSAMELNARLGGGLPLAIAAGADWPGWIIDLLQGLEPNLRFEIRNGLVMSRYDASAFFLSGEVEERTTEVPRLAQGMLDGIEALVFDLDDTLYLERNFVLSGYHEAAKVVWRDYGVDIEPILAELFLSGRRGDNFTEALRSVGLPLPESYSQTLVEIYRSHSPDIKPCLDFEAVRRLHKRGFKTGIVTDGWMGVQTSKLSALGIADDFDFIVISDSLGGRGYWKPSKAPYEKVMEELETSPSKAVYIGDNPTKDFLGAHAAGMRAVRIRRPGAIFEKVAAPSKEYEPDAWISSLAELEKALAC